MAKVRDDNRVLSRESERLELWLEQERGTDQVARIVYTRKREIRIVDETKSRFWTYCLREIGVAAIAGIIAAVVITLAL